MRVPIINKARGAWVVARAARVARVACVASKNFLETLLHIATS
jgi:hypothetical protein